MASRTSGWSASCVAACRWRSVWRSIIGRIEKTEVPVGTLDITLYRDDLSTVGHGRR